MCPPMPTVGMQCVQNSVHLHKNHRILNRRLPTCFWFEAKPRVTGAIFFIFTCEKSVRFARFAYKKVKHSILHVK